MFMINENKQMLVKRNLEISKYRVAEKYGRAQKRYFLKNIHYLVSFFIVTKQKYNK